MFRIALLLFSMIATTLAGSAIVVALSLGYDTLSSVVTAAVLGLVVAIPATWIVARQIVERG